MKTTFYLASCLVFLLSCSSNAKVDQTGQNSGSSNNESCIDPIKGLEVPTRSFTVSGTQASLIELPNGGSIAFPANAFVDENGAKITGNVTIEWKEYHSLTDIMLSGIPMSYDSLGKQSDLISGGMFTIEANQNSKKVELAKGKDAAISLASNEDQQQFNFYSLNEKQGNWEYISTDNSAPNPKYVPEKTEIKTDSEVEEKEYLLLEMNVTFQKDSFTGLNSEDIVAWEVEKSSLSTDALSKLKSGNLKAKITSKISKDEYLIQAQNAKIEKQLIARPITFENKPRSKKRAEKRLEKAKKRQEEFQNNQAQSKYLRNISIPGFGTYNWDCMYSEPVISADINLKLPNSDTKETKFFFICPDKRRVIPISKECSIRISKDDACCIIAITPDKKVFNTPYQELAPIKTSGGGRDFTFQMHDMHQTIRNGGQLAGILNRCI